jgi:predicted DNA-binding transcriptional regulator YafY
MRMNTDRRSFLTTTALSVLGGVWTAFISIGRAQAPRKLPPEEQWLEDWQRASRLPVHESDDPVVGQFIEAARTGGHVEFDYVGGSEPISSRQVSPGLVFRVEGFTGTYVAGYCNLRKAERTFRCDRILRLRWDSLRAMGE